MANVGYATVLITPSFKGFQKSIQKELGATLPKATHNASRNAVTTLGGNLAKTISATVKTGVISGIGAITAATGYTAYKGWDRLLNIEDAKAKLKGLGHDVEAIEQVTERALKAVEGTPYALDEAMATAAGLLASGIAPGEDLERVLGLVADSATLAGTSMGEMGSIWNKIFAGGKVQAEEINQIADRGIPIFQLLAEHLGTNVEGVRELSREGKITADDFAGAMAKYEGAAKQAGDTTRGALENMRTALAKLGADALEPLQPIVKDLLDGGRERVAKLQPVVKDAAREITRALVGVTDILSGKNWSNDLFDVLGPKRTAPVLESVKNIRGEFELTASTMRRLGEAYEDAFRNTDGITLFATAVEKVARLGNTVAQEFGRIASAAAPTVANVTAAVTILGGGLLDALADVLPSLGRLAEAWVTATEPLSALLIPAVTIAVEVITPAVELIGTLADIASKVPGPLLTAGAAFLMFRGHVSGVGGALKTASAHLVSMYDQINETVRWRKLAALGGLGDDASRAGVAMEVLGSRVKGVGRALKTAFITNAPMLVISGLVSVIGHLAAKSAEAAQKQEDLRSSLDSVTGAATEQTRELAYAELSTHDFIDAYVALGGSANDLIDAYTGNADALERVRSTVRATADENGKLEVKNLLLLSSVEKGAQATAEARGELQEMNRATGQAIDLTAGLEDAENRLANSRRAAADANFAMRDAADRQADALQRANELLNDSEAGYADVASGIRDYVRASVESAEATAKATGDAEKTATILEQTRDELYRLADAGQISAEELAEMVAQLDAIPPETMVELNANTTKATAELGAFILEADTVEGTVAINGTTLPADQKLADVVATIDGAEGIVDILGDSYDGEMTLAQLVDHVNESGGFVEIDGEALPARDALKRVEADINAGRGSVKINGNTVLANEAKTRILNTINDSSASVKVRAADHTATDMANIRNRIAGSAVSIGVRARMVMSQSRGGVVDYFANGSEKHVAQIAPAGAWRVWAEPETGGEAYIPLSARKRKRSTEILSSVADRFGYALVPATAERYANGSPGYNTPAGSGVFAGIGTVNLNVDMQTLAQIRDLQGFADLLRVNARMNGAI